MASLIMSLARVTAALVAALVLHPNLMVIGFILVSGEAIMVHRSLSGWSRGTRKSVHLGLQGAALGLGLFGIWARFKGTDGIFANFYSLHSCGIHATYTRVRKWEAHIHKSQE
ncbi:putative transmembrane ascorbate ferrireductase 4 [Acorus gramineus]|uniref:Transmembrane ascorbate ferrireductase 4 n=1 Tax=Acorus gramineus TaxID=55184 RepID=A0AAV9BYG9_ACOGR|nr:putative transmembrane ascorbate ferrireductase 4 [Acorus gramineus]